MSTFALDLQRFAEKTKEKADLAVGNIVVRIAGRLDQRSPVDTGRFRANWQLGVNSVPVGVIDDLDPSGAATQGRIIATIPEKASGLIYSLVNNLPYANRLEEGWSKQAPLGLVGLTVIEFRGIIDEAVESLAA